MFNPNESGKSLRRYSKSEDVIISKTEIYIDLQDVDDLAASEFAADMLPKEDDCKNLEGEDEDFVGEVFSSTEYDLMTTIEKDMKKMRSRPDDDEASGFANLNEEEKKHRLHFVKYVNRNNRTIKLWECGVCSREFQHQYTLMRHLPTHTDVRNYRCPQCNKAFRQLSTLSQHKAIHSVERPYECEVCQKSFNRISTLISHRKTHSEYKPYKCNVCGRGFHQKGNLRNHIFTHTNERPYKCDKCHKGFNQMSNLVCHKVKVHSGDHIKTKFPCNYCEKEFSKQGQLNSHQLKKHGVIIPKAEQEMEHVVPTTKRGDFKFNDPEMTPPLHQVPAECGIIVDRINTRAMREIQLRGRTPYVFLKQIQGPPAFVKVVPAHSPDKHLLVPATVEDLRANGQFTMIVPTDDGTLKRAEHCKVPFAAIAVQMFGPDGSMQLKIEEPEEYHFGMECTNIGITSPEGYGSHTTDVQKKNSDADLDNMEQGYVPNSSYGFTEFDAFGNPIVHEQMAMSSNQDYITIPLYDSPEIEGAAEPESEIIPDDEVPFEQNPEMVELMNALRSSGLEPNHANLEALLAQIESSNLEDQQDGA